MKKILYRKDLVLAGLLISIAALMIIPLPETLMDVMIGINIVFSLLLLMIGVYLKNPSDFSTFPSVILIGTAFRLSISIATTRLILTEGEGGNIIETFGNFVIGGNIAVGLIIFLIITIVQFLVITKGSERIAEVAARFCLDAMPGKQMSIDAEVRAGTMDQEEGKRKRQKLDKDNQFFGAMDGAMKFVKGDAIAGLIIVSVNLIGGLFVGMTLHGLSFAASLHKFTLLTVGDGLVAQIPALFMSMCAATIVTRVTHSESADLGTEISSELIADRRALSVAAFGSICLGLIPGFPLPVFLCLSAILLAIAYTMGLSKKKDKNGEVAEQSDGPKLSSGQVAQGVTTTNAEAGKPIKEAAGILAKQGEEAKSHSTMRQTDRHVLYLGAGLYEAVARDHGREFRDRIYQIWNSRMGIQFPVFAIQNDETLEPWEMRVEFDNVPSLMARLPEDHVYLQTDLPVSELLPEGSVAAIAQGWPKDGGCWIEKSVAESNEELADYTLPIGQAVMLPTFRIAEKFAGQLFSRIELGHFIAAVEEKDPALINELVDIIRVSGLQDIMKYLIEDGVPLLPERLVLETLYQAVFKTQDSLVLAETVRLALRRQICYSLADENGLIPCVLLDPGIEREIRQATKNVTLTVGDSYTGFVLEPQLSNRLLEKFYKLQSEKLTTGRQIVVITSPDIRRFVRNFLAMNNIQFPVISFQEIAAEVRAHPIEIIRLDNGPEQHIKAA